MRSFGLSAHAVGSFAGPWQFQLAETDSFRAGREVIHDFRDAKARATREATEAAERLVRLAGVDGVDD